TPRKWLGLQWQRSSGLDPAGRHEAAGAGRGPRTTAVTARGVRTLVVASGRRSRLAYGRQREAPGAIERAVPRLAAAGRRSRSPGARVVEAAVYPGLRPVLLVGIAVRP